MPRTLSPNAGLRVLSPDEFVYNVDDPTYSGAGEFSKAVTSAGAVEAAELARIDEEVAQLIERAVAEAKAAPQPAPGELTRDVYVRD